jgi:protein TonB
MLNVLLESRAPRARRMRSTMASAMVHAALIAGAVALTMPGPVKATSVDVRDPVYITPPPQPAHPIVRRGSPRPDTPTESWQPPKVDVPRFVPESLPPIDSVGPTLPPDDIAIGHHGGDTVSPIGVGGPLLGSDGSPVDEHLVDRAPRLLGRALEPSYPASLRQAGVQGRVVVQFVVDTAGRAELTDLQVVETAHPLFVDAVRAALARYHFSVGEAGGRKVRTRVQMPFEFALIR